MLDSDFFQENGWLRLGNAVDPAVLVPMERRYDALLGHATAPQVWQLPSASRAYAELLSHLDAPLTAWLAGLLGAKRLRVMQDVLIQKPPGAPQVAWHTDHSYTGFLVPARAMSVRLSLMESDASTGCLAVLSGSHRWNRSEAEPATDLQLLSGDAAYVPPDILRLAADSAIDVPLSAGDISVHHSRTWHMSHPNRSEQTRKTIVVHVFDADCGLDDARTPEHLRGHIRLDAMPLLPLR